MCTLRLKRILAFTLLVGLAVLCGCAHEYLIVLGNGDRIISLTKPTSQGTSYHFTDSTGEEHLIPKSHVTNIKAIAVVKEKEEQKPSPPVKPKKPKHWYYLWLA